MPLSQNQDGKRTLSSTKLCCFLSIRVLFGNLFYRDYPGICRGDIDIVMNVVNNLFYNFLGEGHDSEIFLILALDM